MSTLHFTEHGNVMPTLCEELTTYRRARKLLSLPATRERAALFVLARPHEGSSLPLRIAVNGRELDPVPVAGANRYRWFELGADASLLKPGDNAFEFWTDSTAMNSWSLAIESGHAQPRSFVSDNGGATWRNDHMGFLNVLRGELVARIRLAEGNDPLPPAMAWEDASCPRAQRLREIVPAKAKEQRPWMERVRALTGWLASSWEHTSSNLAPIYAPWDAESILAWGRTQKGHNGFRPVVMCVHYAVAFVSCAQAVGIPARCAVLMGTLNGHDGHFVAEVWFDEHRKWVMVDPNADAIFFQNGVPMSLTEIQRAGPDLGRLIEWGAGTESQRQNPRMVTWIEEFYVTGICFRHRSVWPRTDFLSHPELTPPGHGSVAYCESSLVWEKRDLQRGFGMFPYFADPAYFGATPRLAPQKSNP